MLGGDEIAVSVARSLAAVRVRVTVLGDCYSPARHSRACSSFACPEGDEDLQSAWLRRLRERRDGEAVILACSDDGLELVAQRRAELVELGYHPFEADDAAVLTMLDKRRTYELAQRAGIPVPQFAVPAGDDELELVAAAFAYPCGLKPLASHRFHHRFPGSAEKLLVVETPDELVRAHRRLATRRLEAMVTELVAGPDSQLLSLQTYLDADGVPLFELVLRKLRQYPPRYGDGSYRVSEWDAEVAALGLAFLAAGGVRGFASVEFKRDPGGRLLLMECNHRFVASHELLRRACVDAALLSYERALGRDVRPRPQRRDGVRLWHPADDIRSFLAYRREGELSSLAWARSLLHRQHLPVLRLTDPLPTIAHHWGMVSRALGRRLRPRGRGRGPGLGPAPRGPAVGGGAPA